MRTAPKGKYFIIATDTQTGRTFFPFYDGWNRKADALIICEHLNKATNLQHKVIDRADKPIQLAE